MPPWLQYLADKQLIQPTITLIVGIIAALFAFVAVITNRWTARMRATLDMLERLETHDHFQTRYRAFRKVRREENGIHRIIQISTGDEPTERDLCLDFLNVYEIIALAIRKRILDEQLFRNAHESIVIRDWHAAHPLIQDSRTPADPKRKGDPRTYEHFQWLIERWENPSLLRRLSRRVFGR